MSTRSQDVGRFPHIRAAKTAKLKEKKIGKKANINSKEKTKLKQSRASFSALVEPAGFGLVI